jgi:membrane-associated phospholipid phosphatase
MSPLGPVFQNKFRPLVYYTNLPEDQRTGGSRNSFYSGHVAAAVADMWSMAKVYCDYHPEASKFWTFAAASIPPIVMTYFRIRALDHFPSDLLVGWVVGGTCGIMIPEIHRIADKHLSLGPYIPPAGGGGLTLAWHVGE